MTIILGENFDIQAITIGFSQKVRINSENNMHFIGLNIIALIPMLAKYTFFSKCLTAKDESFL
jgi:hypothetical protein